MSTQPDEETPSCDVCGKEFPSRSNVKRHMLAHTGSRPYACHGCEASFSQDSSLQRHHLVHHQHHHQQQQQQGPDRDGWGGEPMAAAAEAAARAARTDLSCPECGKAFPTRSRLKRHRSIHFKTRKNLPHTATRPDEDVMTTPAVATAAATPPDSPAKMRPVPVTIEDGDQPCHCQICKDGARFLSREMMPGRSDSRKRRGKATPSADPDVDVTTLADLSPLQNGAQGKPLVRYYCCQNFSHRWNLERHLIFHHSSYPFTCDTCNHAFPLQWYLECHRRSHRNPKESCAPAAGETSQSATDSQPPEDRTEPASSQQANSGIVSDDL